MVIRIDTLLINRLNLSRQKTKSGYNNFFVNNFLQYTQLALNNSTIFNLRILIIDKKKKNVISNYYKNWRATIVHKSCG